MTNYPAHRKSPTPSPNGWTPERKEVAATLWKSGQSATQIANKLGGVSRNAVIGVIHRMGLAGESPNSARAKASAPRRAAALFNPTRAKAAPKTKRVAPSTPRLTIIGTAVMEHPEPRAPRYVSPARDETPGCCTLLSLTAHSCRWPIGDPSDPAFTFCGQTAPDGMPYCRDHAAIAYQPRDEKKTSAAQLARSLRRYA